MNYRLCVIELLVAASPGLTSRIPSVFNHSPDNTGNVVTIIDPAVMSPDQIQFKDFEHSHHTKSFLGVNAINFHENWFDIDPSPCKNRNINPIICRLLRQTGVKVPAVQVIEKQPTHTPGFTAVHEVKIVITPGFEFHYL